MGLTRIASGRAGMEIVAILAVRNEALYLRRCLEHLAAEGIGAAVIDNGSTDGTVAIAREYSPRHVLAIEHLPYRGVNDLRERMLATDRLRRRLRARWVIKHDADELLHGRRPGERLAEAIARADREGATVVNFEEYVFVYEDRERGYEGTDYYRTMHSYYLFAPRPQRLMRAFRNDLEFDAGRWNGHVLRGERVVVHPESLVLRHYPALSRAAAVGKLVGRAYPPEALARGWHRNRQGITPEMLEPPDPALLSRWEDDPRALDDSRPCARHFWEWRRG